MSRPTWVFFYSQRINVYAFAWCLFTHACFSPRRLRWSYLANENGNHNRAWATIKFPGFHILPTNIWCLKWHFYPAFTLFGIWIKVLTITYPFNFLSMQKVVSQITRHIHCRHRRFSLIIFAKIIIFCNVYDLAAIYSAYCNWQNVLSFYSLISR